MLSKGNGASVCHMSYKHTGTSLTPKQNRPYPKNIDTQMGNEADGYCQGYVDRYLCVSQNYKVQHPSKPSLAVVIPYTNGWLSPYLA